LHTRLLKGDHDTSMRRRLQFLNHMLTKAIERFETAYPECTKPGSRRPSAEESDESDVEPSVSEHVSPLPGSPAPLRKSNSMTELARGLRLEEGDVHRLNSTVKKRNLVDMETELSGEQLLEAILKTDAETPEKEVWDKQGLQEVLKDSMGSEGSTILATDADESFMHSVKKAERKERDWDTYSI
jgi:hypothetical protein